VPVRDPFENPLAKQRPDPYANPAPPNPLEKQAAPASPAQPRDTRFKPDQLVRQVAVGGGSSLSTFKNGNSYVGLHTDGKTGETRTQGVNYGNGRSADLEYGGAGKDAPVSRYTKTEGGRVTEDWHRQPLPQGASPDSHPTWIDRVSGKTWTGQITARDGDITTTGKGYEKTRYANGDQRYTNTDSKVSHLVNDRGELREATVQGKDGPEKISFNEDRSKLTLERGGRKVELERGLARDGTYFAHGDKEANQTVTLKDDRHLEIYSFSKGSSLSEQRWNRDTRIDLRDGSFSDKWDGVNKDGWDKGEISRRGDGTEKRSWFNSFDKGATSSSGSEELNPDGSVKTRHTVATEGFQKADPKDPNALDQLRKQTEVWQLGKETTTTVTTRSAATGKKTAGGEPLEERSTTRTVHEKGNGLGQTEDNLRRVVRDPRDEGQFGKRFPARIFEEVRANEKLVHKTERLERLEPGNEPSALDYRSNIAELKEGDRYQIGAGLEVKLGLGKGFGDGDVEVKLTKEGYVVSTFGKLGGGAMVEPGGEGGPFKANANAEGTQSIGGRVEMTFKSADEATRAVETLFRYAASGSMGIPGVSTPPAQADLKLLSDNISAIELNTVSAGAVASNLGLSEKDFPAFAGYYFKASLEQGIAGRVEIKDGKPVALVLRQEWAEKMDGRLGAGVGSAEGKEANTGKAADILALEEKANIRVETRIPLPPKFDLSRITDGAYVGQTVKDASKNAEQKVELTGSLTGRSIIPRVPTGGAKAKIEASGKASEILTPAVLQQFLQGNVSGAMKAMGDKVKVTGSVTPLSTRGFDARMGLSLMGVGLNGRGTAIRESQGEPIWSFKGNATEAARSLAALVR